MIDYQKDLIKQLEDHDEALQYLRAAYKSGDTMIIENAIRNVFEADYQRYAPSYEKHIGSTFEDFLEEEGIKEEVNAAAIKAVIDRIGLTYET